MLLRPELAPGDREEKQALSWKATAVMPGAVPVLSQTEAGARAVRREGGVLEAA